MDCTVAGCGCNEPDILDLTWEDIRERLNKLPKGKYWGVPRGGDICAQLLPSDMRATGFESATHILDDLVDSGKTRSDFEKSGKPFVVLFNKQEEPELEGKWLRFPWEKTMERDLEDHVARMIEGFDNINREGLQETPRRYVKFLKEFTSPAEFKYTTFDAEGHDQVVLVRDIDFHSLCEHHLAPFFGKGHIAYLPKDRIVGISKLPRALDKFARRFQNQERITQQVADELMKVLDAKGVVVVLEARHMCMEMRGIQKPGSNTVTSCVRGVFRDDAAARQEVFSMIQCAR